MKAPSNHSDVEVIEVEDIWAQFGPKLPDQRPSQKTTSSSRTRRHLPVWSAAALLTIALHALLLAPVFLGSPESKHHLPTTTEGAAARANNSDAAEFVSTLILIQDHSITTAQDQAESAYATLKADLSFKPIADFAKIAPVAQIEIAGADDGTDESSPAVEATGDQEGRALLFGRYMGQIKARIERAWIYPTNTSRLFQCVVQIKQNRKGEVLEVTMTHCDNNPEWQLSLAKAIQTASPLSAPPSQAVFTEIISMSFNASATELQAGNH